VQKASITNGVEMKNKISINFFGLITSLLLSQALLAGPTYLNISIPTECGNWKVLNHNHCPPTQKHKGKGGEANARCVGGGNGRSTFAVGTQNCGNCLVGVHNKAFSLLDTVKDNIIPPTTVFGVVKSGVKVGRQVYEDQVHSVGASAVCGIFSTKGSNTFNIVINKPSAKGVRMTTEKGQDYVGDQYKVLRGGENNKDYKYCSKVCKNDKECKAYTWAPGACYLKVGFGYKRKNGPNVSGEKLY
jgi:hypothetical protein